MAFPWTEATGWETGATEWDGTSVDSNSKMKFVHYTDMVKEVGEVPFRGAYALHVDLSGGTADAYVLENTNLDISASGVINVRFYMYVSSDLTMAASDRFTVFAFRSASVEEVVVDIRNNSGTLEILASEANGSATVRARELITDKWFCVELAVTLDDGGSDDGTIDFYVNGGQVSTQIASLDQAAVTNGRLGAMNIDAGTTAGHIYFDEFIADDARIRPVKRRFQDTHWVTFNQHVAMGPGKALIYFTGSSNDGLCTVYDTDIGNESALPVPIRTIRTTDDTTEGPFKVNFRQGCYLTISGTQAQANVEVMAPFSCDVAPLKSYSTRRKYVP